MNQDQILSIVRSILKVIGGALLAHGASKAAGIVNAEDTAGLVFAIIGFVTSHFAHSDSSTPAAPPSAGTVAKVGLVLFCVGMLGFGCASFNANVFNSEKLAADSATSATHMFNVYYQASTNGASADTLAKLNSKRDELYQADRDFATALSVSEGLRKAYVANASDTNKTVLNIAIGVVESQASNIVWVVKNFAVKP